MDSLSSMSSSAFGATQAGASQSAYGEDLGLKRPGPELEKDGAADASSSMRCAVLSASRVGLSSVSSASSIASTRTLTAGTAIPITKRTWATVAARSSEGKDHKGADVGEPARRKFLVRKSTEYETHREYEAHRQADGRQRRAQGQARHYKAYQSSRHNPRVPIEAGHVRQAHAVQQVGHVSHAQQARSDYIAGVKQEITAAKTSLDCSNPVSLNQFISNCMTKIGENSRDHEVQELWRHTHDYYVDLYYNQLARETTVVTQKTESEAYKAAKSCYAELTHSSKMFDESTSWSEFWSSVSTNCEARLSEAKHHGLTKVTNFWNQKLQHSDKEKEQALEIEKEGKAWLVRRRQREADKAAVEFAELKRSQEAYRLQQEADKADEKHVVQKKTAASLSGDAKTAAKILTSQKFKTRKPQHSVSTFTVTRSVIADEDTRPVKTPASVKSADFSPACCIGGMVLCSLVIGVVAILFFNQKKFL